MQIVDCRLYIGRRSNVNGKSEVIIYKGNWPTMFFDVQLPCEIKILRGKFGYERCRQSPQLAITKRLISRCVSVTVSKGNNWSVTRFDPREALTPLVSSIHSCIGCTTSNSHESHPQHDILS